MVTYTANILTVLSTAFGSVTCATVIWLYVLQPKIAIDLKPFSSVFMNVMCTVVASDYQCQITVAHVTQQNDCKLAVNICSVGSMHAPIDTYILLE